MAAHTKAKVPRRGVHALHASQLVAKLLDGLSDVRVPALRLLGYPDAAQILVSAAIPEPPPHLQERVVHHRVPQKVADDKPFQRQAAGEREPPHGDHVQPRRLVRRVVQGASRSAVDLNYVHRACALIQQGLDVSPGNSGGVRIVLLERLQQRRDFRVGHRLSRW